MRQQEAVPQPMSKVGVYLNCRKSKWLTVKRIRWTAAPWPAAQLIFDG